VHLRIYLVATLALALLSTHASAVINQAVEDACQSEYLTYCFGMKIPSDPLRVCFRIHMLLLSLGCAEGASRQSRGHQGGHGKISRGDPQGKVTGALAMQPVTLSDSRTTASCCGSRVVTAGVSATLIR